jgi:hypothetical protein
VTGKRLGAGSFIASAMTFVLFWALTLSADSHAPLRGVPEPLWRVFAGWITIALLVGSLVMFGAAVLKGYRRWYVWLGPLLILAALPSQLVYGWR